MVWAFFSDGALCCATDTGPQSRPPVEHSHDTPSAKQGHFRGSGTVHARIHYTNTENYVYCKFTLDVQSFVCYSNTEDCFAALSRQML